MYKKTQLVSKNTKEKKIMYLLGGPKQRVWTRCLELVPCGVGIGSAGLSFVVVGH